MRPVDLARKLRREAAFEPAALDRGKAVLMAAIGQDGRAQAPTDESFPSFRMQNIGRGALVPGARVRVPRDPDLAAA